MTQENLPMTNPYYDRGAPAEQWGSLVETSLQAAADANAGYIDAKTVRIVKAAIEHIRAALEPALFAEARLAAAAPDLLEALIDLADYHSADLTSDFGNEAMRLRKALDAIAKASPPTE